MAQSLFPLPDFTFVKNYISPDPVVGRPNVYDMGASAMLDSGKIKVWDCGEQTINGQPAGNDSIVYTELDPQTLQVTKQPSIVVNRTFAYPRADNYLCQPTVVKHQNPQVDPDGTGPIPAGSELYLMYFECSALWQNKCDGSLKSFNCDPGVYSSVDECKNAANSPYRNCAPGASEFAPSQICLASSQDGINWAMYNKDLWSKDYSHYSYSFPGTEPSVLIPASQPIKDVCGVVDGEWNLYVNYDKCNNLGNNYGTGMPSARVEVFPNGGQQIWLYYIDTKGDWNSRKIMLAKSWDGFHFDPPEETDLKYSSEIRLFDKTPILGHPRFYLAGSIGGGTVENTFGYSFDGVHFIRPDYDGAWWQAKYTESISDDTAIEARIKEILTPFQVGQAKPDTLCMVGAPPGVVADKHGNIDSLDNIVYLSNEGRFGSQNLGQRPGFCYSDQETQHVGSTWDIFVIRGKLASRIKGDVNFDGKANLDDFAIIKANIGKPKCYVGSDQNQNCTTDIFDLNQLVANYGR